MDGATAMEAASEEPLPCRDFRVDSGCLLAEEATSVDVTGERPVNGLWPPWAVVKTLRGRIGCACHTAHGRALVVPWPPGDSDGVLAHCHVRMKLSGTVRLALLQMQ